MKSTFEIAFEKEVSAISMNLGGDSSGVDFSVSFDEKSILEIAIEPKEDKSLDVNIGDDPESMDFDINFNGEVLGGSNSEELEELIERAEEVIDRLENLGDKASPSRIAYVSIYADKWENEQSPYYQVVEVEGATNHTQVDLTPDATQLEMCRAKELALVAINRNGVVRVKAIGKRPENDYFMQVTLTEVSDVPENGEIIGVTVGTSVNLENVTIPADPELDENSSNPIQNMAVTQKINAIETTVGNVEILLKTI